jgi:uncharacterized protein YecE (DUF72 family)
VSELLIGCSGWSYQHWREPVYGGQPPSRWFRLYTSMFPTVEVNSTFYRLPTRRAVQQWVDHAPPGFLFAVKASRYLTHIRRLQRLGEGWQILGERLAPMIDAGRLGPVLWQLPPSQARDDGRLERALSELPPGRHAFEFRHASWFCEPVEDLLRRHGAALVIADHPERPFQTQTRTTDWVYVRLHHGHRGRRGNYSARELAEWAGRVAGWRRDGDVYVYFDNDQEAFAVRNARELRRLLR